MYSISTNSYHTLKAIIKAHTEQKIKVLQIDAIKEEINVKSSETVTLYVVFYDIFRSFEPGVRLVDDQ